MEIQKQNQAVTTELRQYQTGNAHIEATKGLPLYASETAYNDVELALKYAFVILGIKGKSLPDQDIEKPFLIKYIIENFGFLRPKELKLAFDKAIKRELDLKPSDVETYQNFNVLYVSKILSAYRKWSAGVIDENINQRTGMYDHLFEKPVQDEKENDKEVDWSDTWETFVKWQIEGNKSEFYSLSSYFLITSAVYDWMKDKGLITLSSNRRKEIVLECRELLINELYHEKHGKPEIKQKYDLLCRETDDWKEDDFLYNRVISMSKSQAVREQAQIEAQKRTNNYEKY
jgi:hypothetical protein